MPRRERSERKRLEDKLDKVFSELVRRSRADSGGFVECYTCGTTRHWKQMHAGHYISRRNKTTRWDSNNARPQCPGCNRFGTVNGPGESVIFGRRLRAEGVDVDALEALGRQVADWTVDSLEDLLHELRGYLDDLEAKG